MWKGREAEPRPIETKQKGGKKGRKKREKNHIPLVTSQHLQPPNPSTQIQLRQNPPAPQSRSVEQTNTIVVAARDEQLTGQRKDGRDACLVDFTVGPQLGCEGLFIVFIVFIVVVIVFRTTARNPLNCRRQSQRLQNSIVAPREKQPSSTRRAESQSPRFERVRSTLSRSHRARPPLTPKSRPVRSAALAESHSPVRERHGDDICSARMPQEVQHQGARVADLLAAVPLQACGCCRSSRVERVEFQRAGRGCYAEEIGA